MNDKICCPGRLYNCARFGTLVCSEIPSKKVLMPQRSMLTCCLFVFLLADFSPALESPSSDVSELTAQQRTDATKIIHDAKEHVNLLTDRLAVNGKRFDEVLLGDTKDVEADARAANDIKAVLSETAEARLEAARKVVHLLTAEQRRRLRLEMAKPDSERGILEAFAKVFQIDQAK